MKHYQVTVNFDYVVNGTLCGSITDFSIMAYTKEEAQDIAHDELCAMYDDLGFCDYEVEEV